MGNGPNGSGIIEREVRIAAAPETVFAFLTDPAKLVQWMGKVATLDPRPGGIFRLDYNGNDIARGEFVAVEPPRRVVFTWGWEATSDILRPGGSTVEFTLAPDGDGTLLRLQHRDLPEPSVSGHAEGWDYFLPQMVTAIGGDMIAAAGAAVRTT